MKIPKNAKLIIYVQKQELKAYFEYANKGITFENKIQT